MVFVLLAIGMIVLLSLFFNEERLETQTLKDVKPYSVLAEPDNTLDAVIFGDSEAFAAFSPVEMYNKYGFTSFVCASASQYITLTESFVRETLEHQKPKVIFLETNAIFRKMNSTKPLESAIDAQFPVFPYHNLWKNFDPLNINENENDYCFRDDLKGFKYTAIVNKSDNKDYMKKTKEKQKIPATNTSYVYSIYEYCQEKGVELVFVSAPSTVHWNYAKHNTIAALAKKLGVKFIDLNLEDDIGINWNTDTCDRGDHVNYYGATKVSAFFGKYVHNKFDLPDHRNDSAYSDWNQLNAKYDVVTGKKANKT